MGLMPVNDALFLYAEARERPMHVGGLQLFVPHEDAGPDAIANRYSEALSHADIHPRLRRRPHQMLPGVGPWAWEEDANLDLEYHVRHSALPHPGRIRELLALSGRLHGSLLDRSRPLWEAHLIEGLADGRFALYTKVHHALVDGVAAMRMMARGLSDDPDARREPPPWAARPRPGRARSSSEDRSRLRALIHSAAAVGTATRDVTQAAVGAGEAALAAAAHALRDQAAAVPYRAPRSPLNVPITGARRFAADSWSLERMRAVGKAHDATVNDVLLAMCGGALRRYLDDIGGLPDDPLVAMVPVSLRGDDAPDDDGGGNAVGVVLCNLATHLADPVARFDLLRRSVHQAKLRLEGLTPLGVLMLSAISFTPLAFGPLFRFEALRKPPFNVIISNVPGPQHPLYWNGARLDGSYPLSIPFDGQALNITATSYDGRLHIGLIACRQSVPHLQHLLDHLEASLAELEEG